METGIESVTSSDELALDIAHLTPDELLELDALIRNPADRWCPHRPTPRQQLFLSITELEAFYGGAVAGGKTDSLLMSALQYVDYPGYSALLLMKTFSDLSKPGALMDRAYNWLSGTGAEPHDGGKSWTFPNVAGPPATLSFGYLQTDKDKHNYRTAEYQFIGIDELTRFLEKTYSFLFSRLRRLKTAIHIPIRMRSASNPAQPGEPGMEWVERRFIPESFDPEIEAEQAPRILEKEGIDEKKPDRKVTRFFVFARLEDNPYIDAEEYEESLSELDSVTYEQVRKGDWKIRHRGDIYWMFDPRYVFVPWDRWQAVFGVPHIPNFWHQLTVSQDQGTSEGHIGATGWFAAAAENSPITDLVAMYRAFTAIELSPTEVGDAMLTLMGARPAPVEAVNIEDEISADGYGGQAERSRVKAWINSHEAKSERLEYAKKPLRISFNSWTAGPNIGVAQMRDYLRIVDRNRPNPFFADLGLMGRTRFVCVVPNEDWPRRRPGSPWARVEAEFAAYHYKKLVSGEGDLPYPDNKFNDYMDMIKAAAFDSFPRPKKMSQEERIEEQLDGSIQAKNIPALTEEEQARANFSRAFWINELKRREDLEKRTGNRSRYGNIRIPARR
jgi:hypothetical protein